MDGQVGQGADKNGDVASVGSLRETGARRGISKWVDGVGGGKSARCQGQGSGTHGRLNLHSVLRKHRTPSAEIHWSP